MVHVDPFPVGDDTVLITRADRDVFSLLVVPPDAASDAARAAMAQAVRADNVCDAEQIQEYISITVEHSNEVITAFPRSWN